MKENQLNESQKGTSKSAAKAHGGFLINEEMKLVITMVLCLEMYHSDFSQVLSNPNPDYLSEV